MSESLFERLRRRHDVQNVDLEAGSLRVVARSHSTLIKLDPKLFEEFVSNLGEDDIPGLEAREVGERLHVKIIHICIWIEEMVESNLDLLLEQITLERDSDGLVCLRGHYAETKRRVSGLPSNEGGFWESDAGN